MKLWENLCELLANNCPTNGVEALRVVIIFVLLQIKDGKWTVGVATEATIQRESSSRRTGLSKTFSPPGNDVTSPFSMYADFVCQNQYTVQVNK